jgi:hypothetical protein
VAVLGEEERLEEKISIYLHKLIYPHIVLGGEKQRYRDSKNMHVTNQDRTHRRELTGPDRVAARSTAAGVAR